MQISLSKIRNIDGRTVMTTTMEISAPRASSMHSDEIMPISEYTPTPIVAAKNPSAEVTTDCTEVFSAIPIASFFSLPPLRSVR